MNSVRDPRVSAMLAARRESQGYYDFTATVSPRQGWWSGLSELGQDFAIGTTGTTATNRQFVLKLSEWGPPEVWTISLGIYYDRSRWPTISYAPSQLEVRAEITYGSGGTTQVVEIDWIQGQQIALPMNSVSIVASFVMSPPPTNIPSDLRVNAMLARGNATQQAPILSQPISIPTGGVIVPYPNLARRVNIIDIQMLLGERITFHPNQNVTPTGRNADYTTGAFPYNGIELPGLCRFMRITNSGPPRLFLLYWSIG